MKVYYSKNHKDVLSECGSTASGLSVEEAKKRLAKNGKNVLAGKKKRSGFVRFLAQFKDILIVVLLVSVVISVVMAIISKDYIEFVDAGMILGVLLINAVIGYIQERNSEKAMDTLKNMTKPYCTVIRDGNALEIKTEELVVGDIVILDAGDIVPADLRLLEATSLKIEESALTGESVPVEKDASVVLSEDTLIGDRVNMAFMGSVVTYGRGMGVVVSCGMNTEMGKIASALTEMKETTTPLTKRIKITSIILTVATVVVALIVFILCIFKSHLSILDAFSMAIALAVCAIPEGLPACNTITMSMGVKRMSEKRAIVKSLPAVETLGSTEVICSDKTGTLTLNKMTVKKIFYVGENCDFLNNYDKLNENNEIMTLDEIEAQTHEDLKGDKNFIELMKCMILCNDTKSKFDDEKLYAIGDPTEVALVHYGYKFGLNKDKFDGKFKRENEIPFDSDRKLMTTFNDVDGKHYVYTKGAIDSILSRCNRILDNGKIRRITKADKERILATNHEFADLALRNLAFAYKTVEKIGRPTSANTEFDLCFLGLVGMIDPPRQEVKDAIDTCKEAGISTIMITGDHKDTAFAIAKELGICDDPSKVLTGAELNEMSDEQFCSVVEEYKVYARVSPEHKVRIVNALKSNDKIVAMTGDGVNDAPSIKSADIGVGMGITGTDVAKEASDMILTDDNFATIVGAVKEGRHTYNTIIKILMFLLGTSIAELVSLSTILIFFDAKQFFTPALLLWVNFISDTFAGLALGFEKPEKDIMKRKPIKNRGNLFKGSVGANIFASGFFVGAGIITLYCICRFVFHLDDAVVTTICYIFLCVAELLHSYNLKSETASLFSKNPFDNKVLNWAVFGSLALMVIIVTIPSATFQSVMGITFINWWQWLLALGSGMLIIPYFELVKFIIRRVKKGKQHEKK